MEPELCMPTGFSTFLPLPLAFASIWPAFLLSEEVRTKLCGHGWVVSTRGTNHTTGAGPELALSFSFLLGAGQVQVDPSWQRRDAHPLSLQRAAF